MGFGYSVSLSYDGTVVAIGACMSDENGIESGCVRVLEVSGSSWVQVGSKMCGADPYDHFGEAVSLSPDGLVLVVGAPKPFRCDDFAKICLTVYIIL